MISAGRSTRRCSTAASSRPTAPASPSWTPAAQEFFVDWEKAPKDLVAALRSQAGRNPYDQELSDLVGELSTRSEPFRGSLNLLASWTATPEQQPTTEEAPRS